MSEMVLTAVVFALAGFLFGKHMERQDAAKRHNRAMMERLVYIGLIGDQPQRESDEDVRRMIDDALGDQK